MNWQALLSRIGVCEPPLPDLVREASDRRGTVDRRAFLKLAGAGVAALSIDPELLIWTPGQKAIILPQGRLDRLAVVEANGSLFGLQRGDIITFSGGNVPNDKQFIVTRVVSNSGFDFRPIAQASRQSPKVRFPRLILDGWRP